MAVLDALGIKQRHKCFMLYEDLTADVNNLCPYYEFVSCTRKVMGPVGTFYAPVPDSTNGSYAGIITIFPRFFGFSIDAEVYGLTKGGRLLHPFHHGVKTNDIVMDSYAPLGPIDGSQKCVNWALAYNQKDMAQILRQSDGVMTGMSAGCCSAVPRWRQTTDCFANLWCAPEERNPSDAGKQRREGVITVNNSVIPYLSSEPGQDWYNLFAEAG